MARYPYRQQPQMVDTGDVPYVSYISEQAEPLMMQAAANAQQRYDLAQTVIAKYLEENAAAKFRDADYNTVMAKLNQDLENIKTTVKDRYDNQYGQAYPEILKGLSKAKQTYHLAQKAYEEEQKYAPMYAKLQAEGKLLFPEGDPRTRSVFNQEGQYVGGVDFSKFRERSDYDKEIATKFGAAKDAIINEISKNPKLAGYYELVKTIGPGALTDNDWNKIINQGALEDFKNTTTFKIDPQLKEMSDTELKSWIKDKANAMWSTKEDLDFKEDIWGNYLRKKQLAGQDKDPLAMNTFGTSVQGITENNPYVTKTTPLVNAFDKPGWFSGDFNNYKEVEDAIKEKEKLKSKATGRLISDLYYQLQDLYSVRDALKPVMDIIEDYKTKKTKELEAQGLPIPKTDKDWAKLHDADKEYKYVTSDTEWTLNPMAQEGIRKVWANNSAMPFQSAFRVSGKDKLGLVDLYTMSDKINIDPEILIYQLQKNNFNYNENTGEFYTTVVDGKLGANGFTEKPNGKRKKVYFTLDNVTSTYSNGLKRIKQIESDDLKNPEENIIFTGALKIDYNGKGNGYSIYVRNPSTGELAPFAEGKDANYIRQAIKNIIDGHIQQRFTLPAMSYNQQLKQQQLESE